MTDRTARVLIWGCGWAILSMVVNLTCLFVYGSLVSNIVSLASMFILMPVGFWGGRMVRNRGYILSKKYL